MTGSGWREVAAHDSPGIQVISTNTSWSITAAIRQPQKGGEFAARLAKEGKRKLISADRLTPRAQRQGGSFSLPQTRT